MNLSQQALRVKEQMPAFLGNLSGLNKTAHRFVLESLYGICTHQSLRLSQIARSLNEDIKLIKTENRLSRQASRPGLWKRLTDFVISQSAHRVRKDTLLVIDPSDISKKYAKKMEHLARVRDGSEGEIANGYWLCQVIAVECGGHEITPLINHLWSQNAPGHLSENAEVLSCIDKVAHHTGEKGIWVMDRGGDRIKLFEQLIPKKRRFLIRMMGTRHLIYKGEKVIASDLANQCPTKYIEHITKQHTDGSETRIDISFGMREVRLPGFEQTPLCMVVIHGFGQKPLMILTSEKLTDSRKSLWWALEAYLTRWRIEDTLRFAKQSYALEDVRVLGYESLRNMMALALLTMSFTMTWLGQKEKLAVIARHALTAAKRLFGIPDFRYYALSDGLASILSKRTKKPFLENEKLPPDLNDDMFGALSG
jgi:Transposase DDE domain